MNCALIPTEESPQLITAMKKKKKNDVFEIPINLPWKPEKLRFTELLYRKNIKMNPKKQIFIYLLYILLAIVKSWYKWKKKS